MSNDSTDTALDTLNKMAKDLKKLRRQDRDGSDLANTLETIAEVQAWQAIQQSQQAFAFIMSHPPVADGTGALPKGTVIDKWPTQAGPDQEKFANWLANATMLNARASYNANSALSFLMEIRLLENLTGGGYSHGKQRSGMVSMSGGTLATSLLLVNVFGGQGGLFSNGVGYGYNILAPNIAVNTLPYWPGVFGNGNTGIYVGPILG